MRMEKISVRCCVDLGFNVPHHLAWATPLGSTVLVHILSGVLAGASIPCIRKVTALRSLSHTNANCYIIAKDYSLYRIVACFYARCV